MREMSESLKIARAQMQKELKNIYGRLFDGKVCKENKN